jgi:hypothetical protein
MKRRGQVEESCVGKQTEGGHGGVNVEPCGETDRDEEGDEFVGRQGHGDSIKTGIRDQGTGNRD